MSAQALVDALIIGGGPAGLTCANSLGRQLFEVVVFDTKQYRNDRASYVHNFLGFDDQSPGSLRASAKDAILAQYKTVHFQDVAVTSVRKTNNGHFEATDASGKVWTGRKLVLANGCKDIFPDIPGYADCWGYSIFACLFCHGFEEAKAGVESGGILVTPSPFACKTAAVTYQARRLVKSKRVNVYTHGDPEITASVHEQLANDVDVEAGLVTVDDRKITKLERGAKHGEIILTFADGTTKVEGFLTHSPPTEPAGPFAQQLGLELEPTGEIKTSAPTQLTSVPGVYAAGDIAALIKVASHAQFMGACAAAGVSIDIGYDLAVRKA